MEYQQLIALATFAFASTATPGPNNIMLMTSGANVGFVRTIPHMLGITLGFSLMVFLVGAGIMGVFSVYPLVLQSLQIGCLIYLIYLAIKIARSRPGGSLGSDYKPMSFLAAAGFQWINPKAWSMALAAISVYNVSASWSGVLIIAGVFALVNIPSVTLWTWAGQQSKSLLNNSSRMTAFNYLMAGLLLASTLPMVEL
ncbi:LysE family translocator [Motiliproteus coralliicola]|uniref:LysE family translocator n=1 Tax=Motiliproteus coralliicola TaxID=2283196 RepID=A0A369WLB9_9GAMM|nr:LysE family translocator [Motiliproteus coralliicola]RDE22502.1 LysE family translocator [Motiliproteus coralliicola]